MKVDTGRVDALLQTVGSEVVSAASKHAPMHSLHEAHSVIEEEFDEFWELVKLNPHKPMFLASKGVLITPEQRQSMIHTELVQTAAMCVRALYDLSYK